MSNRTAIHRRPFLGALQQLFGHPGTLYDRLDPADAQARVLSSGTPEEMTRTETRSLTETLERSLRAREAVPIGEAIELARRVVHLHDRVYGEGGEGRSGVFLRSWQHLHAAVLILCSEPGSLPQRLDACVAGMERIDVRELPGIARARFLALQAELAAMARSEGGLPRIPEERAKAAATRLILLYVHVLGVALASRSESFGKAWPGRREARRETFAGSGAAG